MPTTPSRPSTSPTSVFGRRSTITSDVLTISLRSSAAHKHRGFDGLDRRAGEAQRRRGVGLAGDLEGDVETAAARVVPQPRPAPSRRHSTDRAAWSADRGRISRRSSRRRRGRMLRASARSTSFSISWPCSVRATPRHHDLADAAGVDPDHPVRAQRRQHLAHRQRAGGAEVGRAEDRDVGGDAGIFDEVADAHDVAATVTWARSTGDGRARLAVARSRGLAGGAGAAARRSPASGTASARSSERSDHDSVLSATCWMVDCSIWSAAVMTLAFIS